MTATLRCEALTRRIGDRPIVDDVSLELTPGEWTSLIGPSGCGKTTLLMMLGLLEAPSSGRVMLYGEDASRLSATLRAHARLASIGFVFQTNNLLDHLSARDNVALPAWRKTADRTEAYRAADALLEKLGMTARAHVRAGVLSVGEAQRVAIARALVNRPSIVLADEPTGSLDSATAASIVDALGEVIASGAALLVATHDAGLATRGRQIKMRDGRLVE